MAFSVRIKGLPATGDKALWTMETPWWNTTDLISDRRFENASWCPGYDDYEAVVSIDEAKKFAGKYAPSATFDHWKTISKHQKAVTSSIRLCPVDGVGR